MWSDLVVVFASEFVLCLNGCLHSFQARFIIEYISDPDQKGLNAYGMQLIVF